MAIINIVGIMTTFGFVASIIERNRYKKVQAILAEAKAEGYEIASLPEWMYDYC